MVAVGLEQLEFLEHFQLATKRLAGCRGSLGGGAGRAVYSDSKTEILPNLDKTSPLTMCKTGGVANSSGVRFFYSPCWCISDAHRWVTRINPWCRGSGWLRDTFATEGRWTNAAAEKKAGGQSSWQSPKMNMCSKSSFGNSHFYSITK